MMKKLFALCLLAVIAVGIQQQTTVSTGEHELGPGPHGAPKQTIVLAAEHELGPGPHGAPKL